MSPRGPATFDGPDPGPVFVDFYDYQNLGDDLLFVTLASRYPHVEFVFIEDHTDGATFAGLPNVRRLRRIPYIDGVLRRLRIPVRVNALRRRLLVKRSQIVVRLGGSLYMEREGWRENAARDAALLGARRGTLFLNGNFGPWRSAEFLSTYEGIFSRALDVTMRDTASLEQLKAVTRVRLAPDMLFSVPAPETDVPRAGVVVSLIDLTGREGLSQYREAYEHAVGELVEDLVTLRGQRVTLVSFCAHEGDEAAIERVLAALPEEAKVSVSAHCYRGDIAATLTVLQQAETVLATRFHAMVLGFAFGCRVACVEYSNKLSNALADLDELDRGWKLADFVAASRSDRYRRVTTLEPASPAAVAERAAGHFTILDELLGTPKNS
ncbi:MAG TPA: polysaccharide pyruvyl transferase family protein [Propionicimonas sp.]